MIPLARRGITRPWIGLERKIGGISLLLTDICVTTGLLNGTRLKSRFEGVVRHRFAQSSPPIDAGRLSLTA